MPKPSDIRQLEIDKDLFYEFACRFAADVLAEHDAPDETPMCVPFFLIRSRILGFTAIGRQ